MKRCISTLHRLAFSFFTRSFFQTVITILLLCTPLLTRAQGEIPVNMYTGQPSIGVPITVLTSHDISVPVSIGYDANNTDAKGLLGPGWSLSAGGSVSREVRGLPDDFGHEGLKRGWLYEKQAGLTISQDIANFIPQADSLAGTAEAGEGQDHAKLEEYRAILDTEPDIFHFSAGGISGSFVFDNTHVIRTIPYRDVKIEPTYVSGTDKRITQFVITTNDGFKYTFAEQVTSSKRTTKNQYLNAVHFLPTQYEYHISEVSYTSQWMLTRIDSPNGAYVTFSYHAGTGGHESEAPVNIGYYKPLDTFYADAKDLEVKNIYTFHYVHGVKSLLKITGSSGMQIEFASVQFTTSDLDAREHQGGQGSQGATFSDSKLKTIKIRDARKGGSSVNLVKTYTFDYDIIDFYVDGNVAYRKTFLTALTESSGCEKMPPIKFEYSRIKDGPPEGVKAMTGTNLWGNPSGILKKDQDNTIPTLYIYPDEPEQERYRHVRIPNYAGTEVILNGVERHYGMRGDATLRNIVYPQGGRTTFDFEANSYLDIRANIEVPAGGLRIRSIKYFDGMHPTPVEKYFEYKDPVTGKASGRVFRKPVLSMPAFKWKDPGHQNSNDPAHEKNYVNLLGDARWKHLTVRTESDIAPSETSQGNSVGYTFVTVRRPGAGRATFEYHAPGTYGESVGAGWSSTMNRIARPPSFAVSMGQVSGGGRWLFPHAPNPDIDHERGLLWRKCDYNEAGKLVRKSETTYQTIKKQTDPVKVWGLRFDRFALAEDRAPERRVYFYGKYFLETEIEKVPKNETVTTYDAGDISNTKYVTESTRYIYDSLSHRMLLQVRHTAADGTVRTTRFKYAKDYARVSGNAQSAVKMIMRLQDRFRHTTPIETISTLKKTGGTERVAGASLVKFDSLGSNKILLESTWALVTDKTIHMDSFQTSIIQQESGIHKLKIDPRYVNTTTISEYTASGQPMTVRDIAGRRSATTIYSSRMSYAVAEIVNAAKGEVAFMNFEDTTELDFVRTAQFVGTGRTGSNAFYPGVKLTKTVTKGQSGRYVLSFWINSNAATNFTVRFLESVNNTQLATVAISVPSTGGNKFRYVQKLISVSTLPSTFKIELQGDNLAASPAGGSAPGLLPVIDDVFFYPEDASMTSYTYELPYGASTITSGSGESGHTVYDKLGRVKYIKDRDLNIVKKISYNYMTAADPLFADFETYDEPIIGTRMHFKALPNTCLTGVTYAWNFGSGYVTGADTTSGIWYVTGPLIVSLKVTHPIHGERTISKTFDVRYPPLAVAICAKGVIEYDAATASVVSTVTCPEISGTPPAFGTIFKATGSGCISGGCTYRWKLRELGGFTWATVGTGATYTVDKIVPATKTFLIKCEISSPDESSWAESTPIQITVNNPQ